MHDRSRLVVNADLGDIRGVAYYDHPDRDSDGPVDYECPFNGHGNGDVLASDGRSYDDRVDIRGRVRHKVGLSPGHVGAVPREQRQAEMTTP